MALNNMGLGFVLTAKDLASGAFDRVSQRFGAMDDRVSRGASRITDSMGKLKVAFGAVAAGAATLGGAFALASKAGDFEQGLAAIGAVTRATSEELEGLRLAAINAGVATRFSPDEAVQGLQSLATAGQTAAEAIDTLNPVLNLAAGSMGQLGVAESAEALVGTLNSYAISAEHSADVTDKLLRITQMTNFQARDFSVGLSKAAAAGAQFGQDLDDVLITMGLLRNANIDASSSSTAFREATRRLASDTKALRLLTESGVSAYDKQTGKMRSVVDIMDDLNVAMADSTDEQRNMAAAGIFGARGLLAFNAVSKATFKTTRDGQKVTLKGAEAINAMREQMKAAGGTAEGFKKTLGDTFKGQVTLLQGSVQTLGIVIGESFARILKPVVGFVVSFVNAILAAVLSIPEPIRRAFAKIAVGIGIFLMVAGSAFLLKVAIGFVIIALKAAAIAAGSFMLSMLPVILIIGAIAAAVYALKVAIDKNIYGIGDTFRRVGEIISLSWNGLVQLFRDGGFSGEILKEINRADNKGIKKFVVSVFGLWHRLKKFFSGVSQGFREVFGGDAFNGVAKAFSYIIESVKRLVKVFAGPSGDGLFSTAKSDSDKFAGVGYAIGSVVGWVSKVLIGFIELSAWVFGGIVDGLAWLSEKFSGASDAIAGTLYEADLMFQEFKYSAIKTFHGIVDPVVKVFDDIVEGISRAIAKMYDIVIKAARLIPERLRTAGLSNIALQATTEEVQAAGGAASRAVSTLPTATRYSVERQQRTEGMRLADLATTVRSADNGGFRQQINLIVDGQKLAEASDSARRDLAERGFIAAVGGG
ncbi:MAG: phage tail tape measure protein [Gammaproteobacteria bacterium]|nr:phage tail tape measure protein [Gammaproteobacteria bacterium]